MHVDNEYLLALNAVPGLGPRRIQQIFQLQGHVRRIFDVSEKVLREDFRFPPSVISSIKKFPWERFLRQERCLMNRHQVSVVTIFDTQYPTLLREIADPPQVLYTKGDSALLQTRAIAIVGCRLASLYGLTTAERLAQEFTRYQMTVVSGLARGVDTAAHRGVLRAHGKTIAVLGTGLSCVYPAENKTLFQEIADQGLVISEFSMATPPRACHFPRRNRIVSGLCLGVVVVEAAQRSGALITADLALDQGREVFAVPGRIDHLGARGVNRLIQQGAKLVGCAQDVLEECNIPLLAREEKTSSLSNSQDAKTDDSLTAEEQRVLTHLSQKPCPLETLLQCTGYPLSHLFSLLFSLELKGLIRQMPGKMFVIE